LTQTLTDVAASVNSIIDQEISVIIDNDGVDEADEADLTDDTSSQLTTPPSED
jgi:hypothetical protein